MTDICAQNPSFVSECYFNTSSCGAVGINPAAHIVRCKAANNLNTDSI